MGKTRDRDPGKLVQGLFRSGGTVGTEEWTRGSGVYTHPGRGFHHLGWKVVGDLECGLFVANKPLFAKYGVYAFSVAHFIKMPVLLTHLMQPIYI